MDYIGEDVLRLLIDIDLLQRNQPFSQTNYEIVAFARLVELLMDRPENRSDTNLEIPPQNSTLPQNYVKFINKETCEIKTIKNKKSEINSSNSMGRLLSDIFQKFGKPLN